MSVLRIVGAVFFVAGATAFVWGLVPKRADEIGFAINDPSYLIGCYSAGDAEIRLFVDRADFDGEIVPISFGMRKTLREVVYPERFPWFNPESQKFTFQNDRFELLNLEKDSNADWALEIWRTSYLQSGNPDDLEATMFRKRDCN